MVNHIKELRNSVFDRVKPLAFEAASSTGYMDGSMACLNALERGDLDKCVSNLAALPPSKRKAFIAAERRRLSNLADKARQDVAKLERESAFLSDLIAWADTSAHKLEKPNGSAWHKVIGCDKNDSVEFYGKRDYATSCFLSEPPQIFIIEHDWSSAFANADDVAEGEWRAPFDHCVFEFRVGGRRVMFAVSEPDGCTGLFIEAGSAFHYVGPPWKAAASDKSTYGKSVLEFLMENVRAACIAIDAGVVVTPQHRAPSRLNAARNKRGEPLLFDYKSLALRPTRAEPLHDHTGTHRSPRLHFRRGHWRQYENHMTWIRWTLVGNPDLGFIDKQYRL